MVSSSAHQNLVANGCGHFLGPCVVTVTGDSAVAVCESLVLVRDGEGYRVWRCAANHFTLRRIDGQWWIDVRTTRVLDGNPDARDLLSRGLAGAV
ncbi:hypothetical protein GCM10023161_18240 [Mycobacterium paraffinicum]|uniref:SnoaL-like domain-containing protein n=1 Tax=Mycobacterium paraffinicum TaxID=53378 RepID=A0ABP8RIR6_9MYCO